MNITLNALKLVVINETVRGNVFLKISLNTTLKWAT